MKEAQRKDNNFFTFFLPQGAETTVVLLDDVPVELYRHQLFIKGDKQAAQMRQTCADPYSEDEVPRTCLICNAMIRHKNIGRKPCIYFTVIDERQYRGNDGRDYKDSKRLLELDKKGGEIFEKRKQAHGSIVGMRFKVFRSSAQNSPRYGDSWEKLDTVDLIRHFWYSPEVPKTIERESRKGGRPMQHQDAVRQLVAPFDYDKFMEKYVVAEAERFIAYLEGAPASERGGGGGNYNAPPPPGGGAAQGAPPPPPAQAAPDYAVPAQQVPARSPAPQAAPQGPPPGYQQQPPPRMPDPRGATAPQQPYVAPPPAGPSYAGPAPAGWNTGTPAPQYGAPPYAPAGPGQATPYAGPPAPGYAGPPPSQPQYQVPPPAQAPSPPPYDYQHGWSATPPGAPPSSMDAAAMDIGGDDDLPF